MKRHKVRWRKLDNSAKIFPLVSNRRFTSVFRVSAVLKEKIDKEILDTAVQNLLKRQVAFKVRMRRGFFWYYFEINHKKALVKLEDNYPCKYIDKSENNGYLFKVTYYNTKINLDIFHSLTDGNTGMQFLQELVYEYLDLKKNINAIPDDEKYKVSNNVEDSYLKNYNKEKAKKNSSSRAYTLHGKRLPLYSFGVIHEYIDLEALKKVAKQNGATITEYITAVLVYSIYVADFKKHKSKKPIRICIPVNLKKYFDSSTSANFFSYMNIEIKLERCEEYSFNDILKFVLDEFDENLTHDKIEELMDSNIKLGVNPFIRVIPVLLKKIAVSLSYIGVRKNLTTTFSNLGQVSIKDEYKNYVDSFLFLLSPDNVGRLKCSAVSYENKFVFSFISLLDNIEVERSFHDFIEEKGIKINRESNGVYGTLS